jgi:hypothetical protein
VDADMDADKQLKFGIIGRMRRDAGLRRKVVGFAVLLLVAAAVAAMVAAGILLWGSTASLADRVAEIGDIFAATTLLLTVIAAAVAYLAYAASTGIPDLKLRVCFGPSLPNQPVVAAEPKNGRLEAVDSRQTAVTIRIRNSGAFPAKNPAFIVQVQGMEFGPDVPDLAAGWTVNEGNETGVTTVQMDGGPAYSAPQGMVRDLPVLSLAGLRTVPGWTEPSWPVRSREFRWLGWFRTRSPWPPLIVISVVTDTSRRDAWIPIDFKVNGNSQYPPEKKLPEWF